MSERELQLAILRQLDAAFPNYVERKQFNYLDNDHFLRTLNYLAGHGLVQAYVHRRSGSIDHERYCITVQGIDHLMDDGGLSAILGVTTIKIHPDSIKEILAFNISSSNLPEDKKTELQNAVKTASTKVIEAIIKESVSKAFAYGPDAFSWFMKMLS